MTTDEFALQAKVFVTGEIHCKTGLHIGGSSSALDIGGIDLNVIKTAEGVPYIPGSSLKGKMRCLLEREAGLETVCRDVEKHPEICHVFGVAGDEAGVTTRLIVRDAYLHPEVKTQMQQRQGEFAELELTYTEGKWENVIDRVKGTAQHPRQQERVPAGAVFDFEMVYNIYNDADIDYLSTLVRAMRLLQDDYLGGSGSRGYGQIEFKNLTAAVKTKSVYEKDNQRAPLSLDKTTADFSVEGLQEAIRQQLNGEH